jgi:long-chain acyl-CoA synthetase
VLQTWGRDVVVDASGPHPVRVYQPRRHLVSDLLLDVRRWADREVLVQGPIRLTYAQHERAVLRVAGALRDAGIGQGDPVMFYARNGIEWVVGYWAVLRLGAIAVLGNGWWSASEVAHAVALIEPKLVLTDEWLAERLPSGTHRMATSELTGLLSDELPVPELAEPTGTETDPALVIFTSGTTGPPKGAMLPHRGVIVNLHNMLNVTRRLPQDIPDDQPANSTLHTLPLFHVGGIQALGMNFMSGSKMVFLEDRFRPAEVLRLIERERVTLWACVPTMLSRVLDHPDLPGTDTESVRSLTVGGSTVGAELSERAAAAFPNMSRGMASVYGLTEAGGTVSAASGSVMLDHPGTVGRPMPVVEVRFEPTGDEMLDAVGGEIAVRSPGVMLGYWGAAPGESDIDPDGWLRTGDVGRQDEDGWLYLVGRKKDIVIRGGENIACAHVEARLREHPDVSEVAVVGLPHADLGEEVGAAIVPRGGAELDTAKLGAFAAETLAHYAVPRRWWVRDEPLPTNATGKIVKRELVAAWPAAD